MCLPLNLFDRRRHEYVGLFFQLRRRFGLSTRPYANWLQGQNYSRCSGRRAIRAVANGVVGSRAATLRPQISMQTCLIDIFRMAPTPEPSVTTIAEPHLSLKEAALAKMMPIDVPRGRFKPTDKLLEFLKNP